MTDDEINQLIADTANEAIEALKQLAPKNVPIAAYGAGLQSSILMRRLREFMREKREKEEQS